MSLQGYSSSEDEVALPELPQYAIPTIPEVSIPEPFQHIPRARIEKEYLDQATFDLQARVAKRELSREEKLEAKRLKKRRKGGPWGGYEEDNEQEEKVDHEEDLEEEDLENYDHEDDKENDNHDEDSKPKQTSKFTGSSQYDYQGRTYMHPSGLPFNPTKSPGTIERFVPKKLVHTFPGHNKGVNKLEFFPKSGHLLLSAGNDGKIKLWDLYHKRELLRIFYGHTQAVKDVTFNSSGDQFLSCGYDKKVQLWNTETGDIIQTIRVKSIPNVVKFNPNNEKEFIVGLSNHDIEHYDLSRVDFDTPIQTYDHHLGAINSLTIIEDNKRFMSTADDKTVRFWDWQINIPVKFISDPSQHSIPKAVVYPGGSFIALQSMDNSVHVIQGHGKYRFNNKKVFTGHNVAGNGIDLDISPDGKILVSGDSKGFVYFWDWKTCKVVKKLKVGDKVISCVKFHPQEVSKVVMAGIGGGIYCYE